MRRPIYSRYIAANRRRQSAYPHTHTRYPSPPSTLTSFRTISLTSKADWSNARLYRTMSLSVNFAKALAVPSIGKKSLFVAASVVIALAAGVFYWHSRRNHPSAGRVRDEARIAD